MGKGGNRRGKNWKGFSKSFGGSGYGTGRHGSRNNEGDATDDRCDSSERSKGSYDLDKLKESEDYSRRVETNAPKRKYAICFGYLGTNYCGLQSNPAADTVEKEVERALFLAGGIQESNFGFLHKIQWTRAARTDRGVHANGQCCAMRLSVPIIYRQRQLFIDRVNSFLPGDIRMHAICKVTKAFNAKNLCGGRRYNYLLPTYMLRRRSEVISHLQDVYEQQGPIEGAGVEGGFTTQGARSIGYLNAHFIEYAFDDPIIKGYRADAGALERLTAACQKFVGTNKYHNYTTGKLPTDGSSKRYIMKFEVGQPVVSEASGVEFVLLTIIGQSFLLNQIRRMIGMCCEVASGAVDVETLDRTLGDKKVEVPMVPGLGLYLDELFFDGYNSKLVQENANIARKKARDEAYAQSLKAATRDAADDQEDALYEMLDWQDNEDVQRSYQMFRESRVWPHIFAEEASSKLFVYYLDSLRARPRKYNSFEFHARKEKDVQTDDAGGGNDNEEGEGGRD
eukprot:GSChrysophyteH1.ASY1.ANO1.239.1 assembled CDS